MRYLWYSLYAFVTALAVYTLFFANRKSDTPPPVSQTPVAQEPVAVDPPTPDDSDVQIVLILDTSSSMDGLIEQARTQLWEVVGEMQLDEDDKERTVSVALFQYGNNRLAKADGYIEKLYDLTTDLDPLSIKLQSLSTSGGKEYAPMAILKAVETINWNPDDSAQKVIVIAGNEGFSQGPTSPSKAMEAAQNAGIKVVPIYCANGSSSRAGVASWKRAAHLAKIELETIDPDKVVAKLDSPYDAEIVKKYRELEECNLVYGDQSYRTKVANNRKQAASYVSNRSMAVQAERAFVQSRQNTKGDLLRDYEGGKVQLEGIQESAMPQALRGRSKSEQKKILNQRAQRRRALKREINELNAKRNAHVSKKMKEIPVYKSSAPSGRRTRSKGTVGSSAPRPTLGSSIRSNVSKRKRNVLKTY